MKVFKYILPVIITLFIVVSCGGDEENDDDDPVTGFDVSALLENVTTNIIVPSYQNFQTVILDVKSKATAFTDTPNQTTLNALKSSVVTAGEDWQKLGLFEGGSGSRFGPSSTTYLKRFINTYPTKPTQIENALISDDYNLEVNYVIQGLPALDYLLYANDDATVINAFSTADNATERKAYLLIIIDKMVEKTNVLVTEWSTYKTAFIANDASGSNGSFSKLLNGVTEYYEQQIRKAKLAGPLGKFSADVQRPQDIESLYAENSKELLLEANQAIIDFYNGKHFGSSVQGTSLKDYLAYSEVNSFGTSTLLSDDFSSLLETVQEKLNAINGDYYTLVDNQDASLDEAYDAFQNVIALLKVEVFSAVDTSVSYSDNDGD